MAFTSSIRPRTVPIILNCRTTSTNETISKRTAVALPSRRQCLLLLTTTTALNTLEFPSRAEDIPLFGFRKKLKIAEEAAEEIVKEGFEAADKGIEVAGKGLEAAEKGLVTAEKGIEAAGKEIETAVSFSGLAQAGVVAGAEVVGVLVATSIVNGILGPENRQSV